MLRTASLILFMLISNLAAIAQGNVIPPEAFKNPNLIKEVEKTYGSTFDEVLAKYSKEEIADAKIFVEQIGYKQALMSVLTPKMNDFGNEIKLKNPTLTPAQITKVLQIYYQEGYATKFHLTDKMVMIQALKILSKDEISETIKFFNTPLGQSVLKKMPVFTQSNAHVNKFFQEYTLPSAKYRVIDVFKSEGIDIKL